MSLQKRSFTLRGHRTSVALEREFWDALEALVAVSLKPCLTDLVLEVDMRRDPNRPLASALRVFALLS